MPIKITNDCMGCQKCMDVCPVEAMNVLDKCYHDPDRCIECKECIDACPVEAIVWED